jgi:6,7-dimethyl-8-ribityllumazine synthase
MFLSNALIPETLIPSRNIMNQLSQTSSQPLHAPPQPAPRIAFIQACWHRDVVDRGRDAFLDEMALQGVPVDAIDIIEVPGAFEIPLHAQTLARAGRHAAIVACALVVDGGIYRHEFVAQAVISGLMQVQLASSVPVFSAVLTPQQFHEHDAHLQFFTRHFELKGREVAGACLRTLASLRGLRLGG